MSFYPGVKGRKRKKIFKKSITFLALNLTPANKNKRRNTHRLSPKRGDRVYNSKCMVGTFVGIDPRGQLWVAYDAYSVQFPYKKQVELFDACWRNFNWKQIIS